MTTTRNKKSRPDQEGSIFYSEKRGRWVAQFTAGYAPKTGRRKLGISTTFHMLRHDMASRMKASHQFDLKDIQTQLGHSTIRVTMDLYTHIGDSEKEQVKNWLQLGVNSLLTPAQPLPPANKIPHNFS